MTRNEAEAYLLEKGFARIESPLCNNGYQRFARPQDGGLTFIGVDDSNLDFECLHLAEDRSMLVTHNLGTLYKWGLDSAISCYDEYVRWLKGTE